MNEYGFDYLNYITNVPNSMNYSQKNDKSINYSQKNNIGMNFMQKNDSDMDFFMNNQSKINMMGKDQPIDPMQGFMRGNLFANLYEPYKNYKPMELEPKNERETLLYQLMQYKFALIELNLYLDTHPNDREMVELYNKYLDIEKKMCNKYESMYGPLSVDSEYVGKNMWEWKNNPWPWEGV